MTARKTFGVGDLDGGRDDAFRLSACCGPRAAGRRFSEPLEAARDLVVGLLIALSINHCVYATLCVCHTQTRSDPPPRLSPPSLDRGRWWKRPGSSVGDDFHRLRRPFSAAYLSLDPRQSRVPQPDNFAPHYPILVAHVIFGSVALLTAVCRCAWFRQRYRSPTGSSPLVRLRACSR